MLRNRFLLLALFGPLVASAQAPTWWVAPDTALVLELPLDSTIAVAQIDFGDAAAADSVVWAWKRVEWDLPAGWQADLCDPTVCHTGVPTSAVQLPLAPDTPSFLKFLISSRGIPGEGGGTFWVFPEGQIQHHLTLHFTFSSGPTAVPEAAAPEAVLYPNPTSGAVHWRGEVPASGAWHVLAASGTVVQSGRFPELPNLHAAPAGPYLFLPAIRDQLPVRIIKH